MNLSVLDAFLLSLLDRGSETPYDLQRGAGISQGASLPSLKRLVAGKLVEREVGKAATNRPRHAYRLTATGKQVAKSAWKSHLNGENPPTDLDSILRIADMAAHYGGAKSLVRTQREAQRLADDFIDEVNAKNNDPRLYSSDVNTVAGLEKKCKELTWPHLKMPTRLNYEYFFGKYLIPALGSKRMDELTTMELQAFFNSHIGKLSPYTIKNMHATLRAALAQAVVWNLIDANPAIGVKLPKKKAKKPTVLLSFADIKAMLEILPEPARTIVTLIVFGSMRVGEALALRWNDILGDRIIIDERLYDDDLDDPKTLHGNREVPFDSQGIMKAALTRIWEKTKHRKPEDFVFATRTGTPTERRNVLRHVKDAAKELKLQEGVDFRSFRTMHASLMRRTGARAEVARDNMGHSECPTTLEIYSKTWWDERAAAVSAVVDMVMNSDEKKDGEVKQQTEDSRQMLFQADVTAG